jgi:hypothetical protein
LVGRRCRSAGQALLGLDVDAPARLVRIEPPDVPPGDCVSTGWWQATTRSAPASTMPAADTWSGAASAGISRR